MSLSMDSPNPTAGGHRAKLDTNSTSPHLGPRNRNYLRWEHSHPIANYPIDRASGFGANRVHSGSRISSTGGAAPSSIEAGLGASGAACVDATKARPPASATINARISVSIGERKRAMIGDGG